MNLTPMLQANELEKAVLFNKIDENLLEEANRLLRIYNWANVGMFSAIIGLIACLIYSTT